MKILIILAFGILNFSNYVWDFESFNLFVFKVATCFSLKISIGSIFLSYVSDFKSLCDSAFLSSNFSKDFWVLKDSINRTFENLYVSYHGCALECWVNWAFGSSNFSNRGLAFESFEGLSFWKFKFFVINLRCDGIEILSF